MRSVRLVLLQQFAAAVQRASASDAMRSLTRAGTERAAKVAKETLEQMAKTVDLMQVTPPPTMDWRDSRKAGWGKLYKRYLYRYIKV